MKILIAGGTGFVGRSVIQILSGQGHQISVLTRAARRWSPPAPEVDLLPYGAPNDATWRKSIARHDIVINLAGASIFRLWTERGKTEIFNSRVLTTRLLVDALNAYPETCTVLFNCSGIGYYGFHGDEPLSEEAPPGGDFLARVAQAWEREAMRAAQSGRRVVLLRLGHVLGENGGVLQKLKTFSFFRMLAPWGDGRPWFSWIHEQDIAAAVSFLLIRPEIAGPVNLTSPNPAHNSELTATLNRLTGRRPWLRRIPAHMIHACTGELSTLFLTGQRVLPAKLEAHGFSFQFPDLDPALQSLLRHRS